MPRAGTLHFPGFRFEEGSGRLWRDHDEFVLRPKTAAVLGMLLARAGEVVTKRELLDQVWPEGFVGDAALAVCVNELRQVLADDARHPAYIATAHRRGYRFIAMVSATPTATTAAEPSSPQADTVGRRGLPFVGRAEELAALDAWWDQARSGERQLVFVAAAAGAGKSTLVDVFVDRVRRRDQAMIGRGQCIEQFASGEAYLPALGALTALCRGPDGRRVREILRSAAPTWLLQLPAALEGVDLDSVQFRTMGASCERMLREAADALEALSAWRPLLLVLEDLHYGDRSTSDLLAYLARRREPARLLVAATYRPADLVARSHPLGPVVRDLRARRQCRHLSVELLAAPAVAEYLARRLAPRRPSPALAAEVHDRTDGNALFVETVVDHLLDHDLLKEEDGELRSRERLDRLGIPESVHQLIERQVESLDDDDRRLLEVASAAGVEFSAEAVAAALDGGAPADVVDVEERCDHIAERTALLSDAGAVEWPDGTMTARYRFVHAMYQEVLYTRLRSPARRTSVHRQLGARLLAGYGPDANQIAGELAMHFERGRDFARAADFHGQAAETALRRSAHREALLHTASALDLLSNQPPGTERARAELRIRLTEASALMAARGFGARAVLNAFVAARPLAEEVGDPTSRFAVLSGLWNHVILRADLEQARSFAEQLEELGRQENELELARQAHSIAAQTHLYAGEPAAATTHAELAHPNGGLVARRRLTPYFQDPVVVGRLCGAIAAWLLGRPDAARDDASEGLRLARELGYQAGTAEALWHTSVVHQCCGEVDLVGALTSELADICRDHALPNWASVGNVLRGWAMARRGDPEGVAVIKGGLAKIGSRTLTWPYHAALLVETLTRNGDRSLALETVREALDMCRSTGERWYEAELVRLRGELLVRDHPDDAAASFAEAQAIARGQQARSLELRAATSLARLLRDRGQTEHARSTLAEVYESFDEGHGTEDLIVASTLLSELSA